jgi:hypothetical protein
MRKFDNKRLTIKDGVEVLVPSPVRAVTVGELGGAFGSDKHRKLILSCEAGDVVVIRPQGTQRPLSMTAVDIYRYMLRNEANKVVMEKARIRKQKLIDSRLSAKIARADRKLRDEARAES